MAKPATSADLGEFFAEQPKPGPRCPIALALPNLDPQRAASLAAALVEPKLQHTAISRTLKKWGHDIGPQSVQRHRNNGCACARS